jgi:ABC-type hemin transport system ATPase subunit
MLKVKNISIGYGESEIIKDVSFALQNGEILAVLGANGAGKTTCIPKVFSENSKFKVQSSKFSLWRWSFSFIDFDGFYRRAFGKRKTLVL